MITYYKENYRNK